ncbi:MAG: hypothetical protein ABUT39_03880 [Acidobacteriota bacterium]
MGYPGSLETIEEASGKLENQNDPKRSLAAFTGYYGLNTAAGGFFSIDTVEKYANSSLVQLTVKISVSLDGKTSTHWDFDGSGARFDGQMLVIPGALQVGLTQEYHQDGRLFLVSGTVLGKPVTGYTGFNPVWLPVFVGTYKNFVTGVDKLIVAASSLKFDFGDGRGLQDIPEFGYGPAMYAAQFYKDGVEYTLMLGTAAEYGLACFITDSSDRPDRNIFAVTIQKPGA